MEVEERELYASLVYNLYDLPGFVRPARPVLWSAEAWDMGATNNDSIPERGLYARIYN